MSLTRHAIELRGRRGWPVDAGMQGEADSRKPCRVLRAGISGRNGSAASQSVLCRRLPKESSVASFVERSSKDSEHLGASRCM